MIYTKELPYTFSEVEHALSYDILSHIFGVDAESIKGTVQYTNLAEMTGIIYAYDTPIRDIWSECFDNADIIVPSKIERGQLLDDKTYVTKYTKERQPFYFLNSLAENAEPMIVRIVWDHLVLQKIKDPEDAIIELIADFGFGIDNSEQLKRNKAGGFTFAKE